MVPFAVGAFHFFTLRVPCRFWRTWIRWMSGTPFDVWRTTSVQYLVGWTYELCHLLTKLLLKMCLVTKGMKKWQLANQVPTNMCGHLRTFWLPWLNSKLYKGLGPISPSRPVLVGNRACDKPEFFLWWCPHTQHHLTIRKNHRKHDKTWQNYHKTTNEYSHLRPQRCNARWGWFWPWNIPSSSMRTCLFTAEVGKHIGIDIKTTVQVLSLSFLPIGVFSSCITKNPLG